jgi:LuxR family maltose regulon positive regulatory protein
METALALAAPDSYRRIFVEGGPTVRSALVEHVRRGTAHRAFVSELHACFDRRGPRVDLSSPQLLEPLSPRERAVLAYLPTMMSNGEIASELFLSVNTVKTHLRSIYRKLGTNRRREAVELARKLQLL